MKNIMEKGKINNNPSYLTSASNAANTNEANTALKSLLKNK